MQTKGSISFGHTKKSMTCLGKYNWSSTTTNKVLFNQLVLSVISAQNEIKNASRVASSEITELRKEMRTANHNFEQQLKGLK